MELPNRKNEKRAQNVYFWSFKRWWIINDLSMYHLKLKESSRTGFEPVRGDPIGFRVQRLNHSATVTVFLRWFSANVRIIQLYITRTTLKGNISIIHVLIVRLCCEDFKTPDNYWQSEYGNRPFCVLCCTIIWKRMAISITCIYYFSVRSRIQHF